jgi:uncharacterized membrane protein YsdA (DUF1294 family)
VKPQYIILNVFIISLVGSYYLGQTPPLILSLTILFSALTFAAYLKDKKAAKAGKWRVSENTLHLLALLCGWPGAIIAQQWLRHKTKKVSFKIVFWLTVLINTGVVGWLHTQQGSALLHTFMTNINTLSIAYINPGKVVDIVLFLTFFRPV